MTTRFADHLLTGIHSARPAASAVPAGTLYSCTTHSTIDQSDGSSWSTYATLAAALSSVLSTGNDAGGTAILNAPVELTEPNVGSHLQNISLGRGVQVIFRVPLDRFYGISEKSPTLSSLLKITLRPRGLDFYMEGETVIIDTAANVRARVDR
jgi:hypothetical protein